MATRTLREKKTTRPFSRLNFHVYINVDNRERARGRHKKTETNFVGRKQENFIATVRNCEMLAATKVKMSGSERKK